MKPRKNPKHDLERKRGLFFSIGLCLSMAFTLTAFEYAVPVSSAPIFDPVDDGFEKFVDVDIPLTIQKERQPKKQKKVIIQPVLLETAEIVTDNEVISVFEPESDDKNQDAMEGVDNGEPLPEEPIEDAPPVLWAEKMPVPEGGMKAFYAYLKKHLDYPSRARRMGIEGRVFVSFVVDKNGNVSDVSIMKGIGAGCDESAMKVISDYPAWEPGRQGREAVSVRMVMPISFILSK